MFVLGKLVSYLLNPFFWFIVLLFAVVLVRDHAKRKKIAVFTLAFFLFFSNPWLIKNIQLQMHSTPLPMKEGEAYDVGIVLGGMSNYDKTTNSTYFNQSSDRFIQTALLYKKGYIKKILACGGQNGLTEYELFKEADFIAQNLMDLGIPQEDIWIENQSKNTIENAEFAKKILTSKNIDAQKSVLITSAFHMPRAMQVFEKAGIAIRPYPCALTVYPSARIFKLSSLIPASWAMDAWGQVFKEWGGILYLKMKY